MWLVLVKRALIPALPISKFHFAGAWHRGGEHGIARAAVDNFIELAQSKKRAGSSTSIAERSYTQMQAEAEATLRSARAFYYDSLSEAQDHTLAGNDRARSARNLRLATTHAGCQVKS